MTNDQPRTNLDRLRDIASAEARMPKVDANGRIIGKPSKFVYDHRGRLVSAEVGDPEPDSAA